MNADTTTEERRNPPKRFSFGTGNLLMLIALVAICIAWWGDRNRNTPQEYDVPVPLFVSYTVRASPSSTLGNRLRGVKGMDFRGDSIVVYTQEGGIILSAGNLIEFSWSP